jgi:hypothetical protein
MEAKMQFRRLAKDAKSIGRSRCPALYATDDDARMVAQVRRLIHEEPARLLEVGDDETAGSIPTETVFRAVAEYATEHGDDALAAHLEAFLAERNM